MVLSRNRPLTWTLLLVAGATPPLLAQGPPRPVVVAPVTERDVPATSRLVGTVEPSRAAVVAAEVSGIIATLDVEEGQYVRAGEPLCRIDAEVAELRLVEARARHAALQSALTELENGTRTERLEQLRAAHGAAAALHEKWKFERDRIVRLYGTDQSSAKEMHDTEMEYQAAERRLVQAKAELDEAVNGPRVEVIAQARHELAAQAAIVRRLERDLARTTMRAPFDGFVVAKRTEVGEWIEAGGAVCEMVAIDVVRVRFDLPELAVPFARPGAPASVEIEALGRSVAAPLARVIPRARAAARSFPAEIDLPNPDHDILPGMFVWAHVPAGPQARRLMVHRDALVLRGTLKQVYVVRNGDDGRTMAMPVTVTTGLEHAGEVAVDGPGLAAGDLVVVRANERLMGPSPVIPTRQEAAPTADTAMVTPPTAGPPTAPQPQE